MVNMEKTAAWILQEMETAEQSGAVFYLDETAYTMAEKEKLLLVLEDACYMADYVGDKNGKITEVHINRVDSF